MHIIDQPADIRHSSRGFTWILLLATAQFLLLQMSTAAKGEHAFTLDWHFLPVVTLNLLLLVSGLVMATALFRRFWAAGMFMIVLTVLISYANQKKLNALGDVLKPAADYQRIADVLPFLNTYLFSRQAIYLYLYLAVCASATVLLQKYLPVASWGARFRIQAGLSSLAIILLFIASAPLLPKIHMYQQWRIEWTYTCQRDGVPLVFLVNLRDAGTQAQLTAPSGYGPEQMAAIVQQTLGNYQPVPPPNRRPDVILIAAEAMMDPSTLPDISHPVDWLSSIHRLQQQSAIRSLASPTFGGFSINADFEVLTGFPERFAANAGDTVADGLTGAVPSLARVFKDNGYQTIAILPTPSTLFRHEWVFSKAFGFDRAMFQDELGGVMGEISDSSIIARALQELDRPSKKPKFIYIQLEHNHMPWDKTKGYSSPEVVPGTKLSGADAASFGVYVQGVYETDRLIGNLATTLEKHGTPVVLGLYGDHLPALGTDALQKLGVGSGSALDSPEAALAFHTTPGFVWSNAGPAPPAQASEITGMNYMAVALLRRAGISHPFYTGFLPQAERYALAIDRQFVVSPDGNSHRDIPPEAQAEMKIYELLEYDMIYGKQYAAKYLFPELTH